MATQFKPGSACVENNVRLVSQVDKLMQRYTKGHDLASAAIKQALAQSLVHGGLYFKPLGVSYLNTQRAGLGAFSRQKRTKP